ncbi:MAG: DUF2062 domain-containing protein [Myxococcota bacterium]|nr:DUF2062 domain-containing protein [Myxococcota bacterium]
MESKDTRGAQPGLVKAGARRLIAIFREKDSPHKIAKGMALGIFVGILPIMGIQMAVVTILALPMRGNLKAAIAGVWISNPITFIPMYWGYYKFGLLFFPAKQISWEKFNAIVSTASEWNWREIWQSISRIIDLGADILIPMWTGAVILAVVFCIPTYFFTKQAVVRYRARQTRTR